MVTSISMVKRFDTKRFPEPFNSKRNVNPELYGPFKLYIKLWTKNSLNDTYNWSQQETEFPEMLN